MGWSKDISFIATSNWAISKGSTGASPRPWHSSAKSCDFRMRFLEPKSSACAMRPGSRWRGAWEKLWSIWAIDLPSRNGRFLDFPVAPGHKLPEVTSGNSEHIAFRHS